MWIYVDRLLADLCDRLLVRCTEGHGTTDVPGSEPGSPGDVQDGCFTGTEPRPHLSHLAVAKAHIFGSESVSHHYKTRKSTYNLSFLQEKPPESE